MKIVTHTLRRSNGKRVIVAGSVVINNTFLGRNRFQDAVQNANMMKVPQQEQCLIK